MALKTIKPRLASLDTRTVKPPERTWASRKAADPSIVFYASAEWQAFRAEVISERGKRCEECGATPDKVYVDHVREIRDGGATLDTANVRVLCASCHVLKTNRARAARMAAPAGAESKALPAAKRADPPIGFS